MRKDDRNLIIAAVILCLVIGILAPFIASPNPDGLEKSAEQISNTVESGIYSAPMPDYAIPGLGKIGEIWAMFLGIIVTLVLALIVGRYISRRRKPPEAFE